MVNLRELIRESDRTELALAVDLNLFNEKNMPHVELVRYLLLKEEIYVEPSEDNVGYQDYYIVINREDFKPNGKPIIKYSLGTFNLLRDILIEETQFDEPYYKDGIVEKCYIPFYETEDGEDIGFWVNGSTYNVYNVVKH